MKKNNLLVGIGIGVLLSSLCFTYFQPVHKIYMLGEKSDCEEAGGIFSYNGLYGEPMTCKRTTNYGKVTTIETIFDYQIND